VEWPHELPQGDALRGPLALHSVPQPGDGTLPRINRTIHPFRHGEQNQAAVILKCNPSQECETTSRLHGRSASTAAKDEDSRLLPKLA
jgi:hypothetical protein